jgi:hypothetical protein
MAFGQPAGPPATHRQLEELTALLQAAGPSDFRDARDAFIERLQADRPVAEEPAARPTTTVPARPPRVVRTLRDVPTDQLAAELERRGWTLEAPDPG